MTRWTFPGFCSVCLAELPPDRQVAWCGRRCRGVHRALARAGKAGDRAKLAQFRRIADERTDATAAAVGCSDRFELANRCNAAVYERAKSAPRGEPAGTVLARGS